jgi:cobalt-zinc-cadmium efflux system outer membrane protein
VSKYSLLLLSVLLTLGGCAWPVREATDQTVRDLVEHPFDISPELAPQAAKPPSGAPPRDGTPSGSPASAKSGGARALPREMPVNVPPTAWMEPGRDLARPDLPRRDGLVQTVAWDGSDPAWTFAEAAQPDSARQPTLDLNIPTKVPGSEAPRIQVSSDPAVASRQIDRIYPELPPLPIEPKVQPGPDGKPYTLAELQRIAAANNPKLRQAASDVIAAQGNLIQAMTYPNPTVTYKNDPTDVNNTAGTVGGAVDQVIITGGKLRLGAAAARKDLDNAILALKRARSDLATAVRGAYFTVLVDVETLVVTRALVRFSDDIYRLQVGLLRGLQAAPYEPTALLAQTHINRLAYKQAIASYIYDWKALVATLGLSQIPLSQIAGQVDRFIPYFDYDDVRAYMLEHHTDVLTARNVVKKSQYLLKLAQVTPLFPNIDVNLDLERNFVVAPFGTYHENTLGFPLPIWDQNKGNIVAAQGAVVRAGEESHRVEVTLTGGLVLAYEGYRNNLYAMEYYRRNILPDLVRYYRGVFRRRQTDLSSAFGDLVFAQQNLTTNVTAYITLLGSLWSSVVSVADFLQTDDLYQLAKRKELPELPDFQQMQPPHWLCGHTTAAASYAKAANVSGPASALKPLSPSRGDGAQRAGEGVRRGSAQRAGEGVRREAESSDSLGSAQSASERIRGSTPDANPPPSGDVHARTVAWTQPQPARAGPAAAATQPKLQLEISPRIPGSEAPRIDISEDTAVAAKQLERIYPELPPLPIEPNVQPGPDGKPYTLADFQRLAAANSPTLRQAASDVETGKGTLIQAMTYTNPTASYMQVSSNNTNTAMAVGGSIDQPISMGGKQKLGVAVAQKSLENSTLALKRARSDLSTAVRNAYFTVLVDVETLIINRALVRFSDDIYRLQVGLQKGALTAPYEPTALRAQTYINRLAYKQAIASYIYDWKALVATVGLPQLPLSEISGEVDRFIPYYDYDDIRAYMLEHHTDVLTAQNGVKIAQYNLKLAQVTPVFPDLDVNLLLHKDFGNPPHGTYQDVTLGFPLPIWDQNKGNIIAAQAALVRASEENHRVEVTLTSRLALAYEGYRNNLYAMEYYRRYILPDLVRFYRGVFARRQTEPMYFLQNFGDLVFAQQTFSSNVTTYIGILGSLWTSVVSVADFLQTDDLYQLRNRRELPELPDLSQVPHWACSHGTVEAVYPHGAGASGPFTPPSPPRGEGARRAGEGVRRKVESPDSVGSAQRAGEGVRGEAESRRAGADSVGSARRAGEGAVARPDGGAPATRGPDGSSARPVDGGSIDSKEQNHEGQAS